MKPSTATTDAPCNLNRAACENLTPEIFAQLSKLGLSIVIVLFENLQENSPVFNRGNLPEKLGRDLYDVRAGQYDSTFYHPGEQWHFYHTTDVAAAVRTLIAGLDRRGVLQCARIFTAESPNELVCWHPPTAERLVHLA